MADVSLRDADRGQLFLVGALSLAILFISVALLLNTAIYTENLATRSDGASATDAINFRAATERHAAHVLEYVNHNKNTTYTNETTHFKQGIEYWSNISVRHQATNGRITTVEVNAITRGARIQQDERQPFTPRKNASDYNWHLVNDTRVRNHQMTLERDKLLLVNVEDELDSSFHVNVTDSTGATWTVYLYRPNLTADITGDAAIRVVNGSRDEVGTCTVEDEWVTVDFANATFDGKSCKPLESFENVEPPLDISYRQADESNGTYTLVVDKERADIDNVDYKFYEDSASDSPYTTPALYQSKLKLIYRSDDTYYRAFIRVAPGETDA